MGKFKFYGKHYLLVKAQIREGCEGCAFKGNDTKCMDLDSKIHLHAVPVDFCLKDDVPYIYVEDADACK